jgi:hypothetical protein
MSQLPQPADSSIETPPRKTWRRAIISSAANWATGLFVLAGVGLLLARGAPSGVWWIVVPTWLGIGIAWLVSLAFIVSNLPELDASQARLIIVGTCFFLLILPHNPGWLWAVEFWMVSAVMYWLDQSRIQLVKRSAA